MRIILEIQEKQDGIYLPAEMLEEAGLSPEEGYSYTIEEGRILIEGPEGYEQRILEDSWEDAKEDAALCCLPQTIREAISKGDIDCEGNV